MGWDNFFLFTPMHPEVSSGMIETRRIVTPVRVFCKSQVLRGKYRINRPAEEGGCHNARDTGIPPD